MKVLGVADGKQKWKTEGRGGKNFKSVHFLKMYCIYTVRACQPT